MVDAWYDRGTHHVFFRGFPQLGSSTLLVPKKLVLKNKNETATSTPGDEKSHGLVGTTRRKACKNLVYGLSILDDLGLRTPPHSEII